MKRIIYFLLVFLPLSVFGQRHMKLDSIPVYTIINSDFHTILDSFINEERQYEYYNDNVTFFVNIMNTKGNVLQISSGDDLKNKPLQFWESDIDSTYGIFYYKTHSFVIRGRSVIDSDIMIKTNKYIIVEAYNESMLDIIDDDVMEDDTYFPTMWFVRFENNKFEIGSKFPMEDYRNR
ncbi:MAG: hypothetical protein LBL74_04585 [Bacteroidales bacterium]|jgi:hypothetical protein|nr:hypothetical protein [Bacteroidales bacterium]